MYKEIEEPLNCPVCESQLYKVGDQLFCRNVSCEAQLNAKIVHFCKTLSIKGLGPKTAEKLQLNNPLELYYLDEELLIKEVGQKVANKILYEIEQSKNSTLSKVLESFSIPLIGATAAKKLAAVINSIDEITESKLKEAGLGEKASQNILMWLDTEWSELKEFSPFVFTKELYGETVCITGKLKSYAKKADAEKDLLNAGYVLVDSVTKNLSYLVDEENNNSTKRQRAEKYNIKIITDLNDLLNKEIK